MVKKFRKHVFVCTGYDCAGYGAEELMTLLGRRIREHGLADEIMLTKCGCVKECEDGPIVLVYPDGVWYSRVLPEDVDEIVDEHLTNGQTVSRLLHFKMD
ncbi:MAG: (2Fe-2S) ferredoxin domain-containing protein [Chloroflexi bacterium]|nr:(2Fe-2S) ferredoxin domain-containing protein [Chloroflexota bacterium]